MKPIETCPYCDTPTQTRRLIDRTTVVLDVHPAAEALESTYVLRADGIAIPATAGSTHAYRRHSCMATGMLPGKDTP